LSPSAIKVLDDEGNELPAGEIGLLYAKHPVMDFEYHGEAEKTASAHSSDGFFTLGDMGYIDGDGWLYLVDRRTDMINSGGVNVYPAEIEDRLVGHDAVLDAAVIGVPDAEWGQRVVAVVAPRDGHAPSDALAQELLAHCQSALAKFKCPRTIEFRAELPRLPSGKLARRVLRDELSVPTSGYPQNQEIQR
jgi:long-chain acyl-CoA synthetase